MCRILRKPVEDLWPRDYIRAFIYDDLFEGTILDIIPYKYADGVNLRLLQPNGKEGYFFFYWDSMVDVIA